MSSDSPAKKSWLRRNKVILIVGTLLLCFVLAPFPLGLAMIYPITDTLRGHPQGPHGSQPQEFAGFWVRDEAVMNDFVGQAFGLMPDGRFAGMPGMTRRRWHFDDNRLYIDSVSLCGNCYRGNVTAEHTIKFIGPDQMFVTNKDKNSRRGIAGRYRKVEITQALKSELSRLKESEDEGVSFKARITEKVIGQLERLSDSRQ